MATPTVPLYGGRITTSQTPCQRWTDRRLSWQIADRDRFDARQYDVTPIDEATARRFVLRHHYLGSYPADRLRFGLHRNGDLVGVAVYSIPPQAKVLTLALPGLVPYRESLELGRFILADEVPGNGESWFLGQCHRQLLGAGVRGVVSFADPVARVVDGRVITPGHLGTIYQATNARYTGRGTPRSVKVLPDGTTLSERSAQKIRKQEQGHEGVERRLIDLGARAMRAGEQPAAWLKQALADVGTTRRQHAGCHRYVFQLGRNQRDRDRVVVGLPGLAYPKQLDVA